jgi:hypothetical protein
MSKFFRVLNLIIKESETFNLRFYTKNLRESEDLCLNILKYAD